MIRFLLFHLQLPDSVVQRSLIFHLVALQLWRVLIEWKKTKIKIQRTAFIWLSGSFDWAVSFSNVFKYRHKYWYNIIDISAVGLISQISLSHVLLPFWELVWYGFSGFPGILYQHRLVHNGWIVPRALVTPG